MLKKVSELDMNEKLLFLEAIASGTVDRTKVDESTLFACGYKDYFLGLMIAASSGSTVIVLGEARKAEAEMGFSSS